MSFFNDALNKAKKAADTVGKGATAAADTAKLKIGVSEAKSEIKKSYTALGELVYEAKMDGYDATAQIEEAVANINALKDKIADLNAQLLKISNKTICANCGEINPITSSFCAKCGAKIETEVVEEAEAEVCDCACSCGEVEEEKAE